MKLFVLTIAFFALCVGCQPPQEDEAVLTKDEQAIKEVIVKAYVEGIYIKRDSLAVRKGFHEDFLMHVNADGHLIQAGLDMWLARLKLDGIENTNRIKGEFKTIDVSGNAATVRIEVFENSKHLYTDYFGLYKFADGWKIVNKIFYTHP